MVATEPVGELSRVTLASVQATLHTLANRVGEWATVLTYPLDAEEWDNIDTREEKINISIHLERLLPELETLREICRRTSEPEHSSARSAAQHAEA